MTNAADAAAASLLPDLTRRDRRLINSWRQAGFDLTDSLLHSGVLVGTGGRRHPSDVQERDLMTDYLDSIAPPTRAMTIRQSAEHEAAHAITAQELGFTVGLVVIEGGAGVTRWTPTRDASPVEVAAVIAAGEVWVDVHRSGVFTRGPSGCEQDRRMAAGYVDSVEAAHARQLAHRLLRATRADVLALADALERHDGVVDLSDE